MGEASYFVDSASAGNPEAFVRHLVANAIEDAYREELRCDRIHYYYDVFRHFPAGTDPAALRNWDETYEYNDEEVGAVRSVWHGAGLIRFIRTVQRRHRRREAGESFTIYATSSRCKGAIRDHWDRRTGAEVPDDEVNVAWIGDVGKGPHMCCGSDVWCWLWDHVLGSSAIPLRDQNWSDESE